MKILVCIKQCGDNGDMNRFDEFALEEALILKEKAKEQNQSRVYVEVICAGGSDAVKIIRRAFGMGADQGIHIVFQKKENEKQYISPFTIASLLSAAVREREYDLILTGIMSQDMMYGQTGPMLAEILNFPCATGVVKIDFSLVDNLHETPINSFMNKNLISCCETAGESPGRSRGRYIQIERELENGFIDCLAIKLPALLTIQAGINIPRYPSLSNLLAAEKKTIITRTETDLFPQPVEEKELYVSTEMPQKTRDARVLEGSLTDKVKQLLIFFKKQDIF